MFPFGNDAPPRNPRLLQRTGVLGSVHEQRGRARQFRERVGQRVFHHAATAGIRLRFPQRDWCLAIDRYIAAHYKANHDHRRCNPHHRLVQPFQDEVHRYREKDCKHGQQFKPVAHVVIREGVPHRQINGHAAVSNGNPIEQQWEPKEQEHPVAAELPRRCNRSGQGQYKKRLSPEAGSHIQLGRFQKVECGGEHIMLAGIRGRAAGRRTQHNRLGRVRAIEEIKSMP